MIRWFDKQVADSISREGAKLIRTLIPDEESVDSCIITPNIHKCQNRKENKDNINYVIDK